MIFEVLSTGSENAITGNELCKILDISRRELSTLLERERRAGRPICASYGRNPGYFIAETQEEMRRFCQSLMHTEQEIRKTRRACIDVIDTLPTGRADHGQSDQR